MGMAAWGRQPRGFICWALCWLPCQGLGFVFLNKISPGARWDVPAQGYVWRGSTVKLNCCMLMALVGFQPWSNFYWNGSKCGCINFASHVRSGARPLLASSVSASLAAWVNPAARASQARSNTGCWAFPVGEVGDAKGNCDYTKHDAWLLSCSSVHSSGSITLQQLTVNTAPTSMRITYSTGITYSPHDCSGSVCCQPVPPAHWAVWGSDLKFLCYCQMSSHFLVSLHT